jgi:NADH-quinone oxidoreductase subunit G
LPFDSLKALRACLYAGHPHFATPDEIAASEPFDAVRLAASGLSCSSARFVSSIADFYLTNPIARASAVMAECSALAEGFAREAAE